MVFFRVRSGFCFWGIVRKVIGMCLEKLGGLVGGYVEKEKLRVFF